MNKIRVSVIIPTYNCGRFIAEAIESVLAQTRQADEIVIVDDGSTDDTRAVVATFSDPRIEYARMPHKGTSATRSKGIDLASGDYLAFLDADDLWRPTMLEKQIAVMESDETLVCSFTNFTRFEEGTDKVFPDQFVFYPEIDELPLTEHADGCTFTVQGDAFVHFLKLVEIPVYMQCTLFRRSLMGDMRLNESIGRCQDREFVLRVYMRGRVAFTREILADIRRHGANATWDLSLIAVDKLRALLPLRDVVDTPPRRAALNDRLVKSWIDAATSLIRAGKRTDGLGHYAKAFTVPGSRRRKVRGTARIAYELVTSFAAREPGSRAAQQDLQPQLMRRGEPAANADPVELKGIRDRGIDATEGAQATGEARLSHQFHGRR